MPDLSTIGLFAIACLALTATPGPDMLLIASRSPSQGRASGLATYAGIAAGTYCHALAAAFGLSQLFLAAPIAYDIVRYAGAAYLAYLAWKAFRSDGTAFAPVAGLPRYSRSRIFRQGLLTNLLNPKMALFVLALFPQFVRPETGSVAGQILLLATVLNLIGLVVNGLVILTASRIGAALSKRTRFQRAPQILLGTVFAGLAARLAFGGQR
ncbi:MULTISPECIES: LysE family translocator [Mesorhizobium]|uniref:Amino acid transporter n=2 Tax=Mesorhizobium TaxID=68287 RepID=A0A1A5I6R3_RHILI|nr:MULTISPECIES: LysE family translocator [Mesorhizobium]MBE1710529.1 LysE family translocator [Mesorhizobium japonicum]MBE1712427.1 LysE family translocator [Mesorhizobium japonicum]MUT22807.1 LysE family translocator [Mesorhizobium japonicum]MUT29258.1 LysE family translocator [Mesorhizobium japonicum]OBP73203.1 amino acid transporter [Mesorhizobium loti]